MKKNKVIGYMLGNKSHVVVHGDQWCQPGIPVYICANKDTARAILEDSQKFALEPNNIVWTTIYRVRAKDIEIDKYEHDLIWTHQGNKIIVEAPVFYRDAPKISEEYLLNNARQIRSHVLGRVKSASKERRK